MTRLARVDMYAVAPLMPSDKVAGRVASKGEHFEWSPPERQIHSSEPLALRSPSPAERSVFSFVDLTGLKAGRLKVLGIAADPYLSSGQRWVVRCVCGAYEVRRAKYLKACAAGEKTGTDEPMCSACSYTRKLQLGYHNPKKAAAAAEAIRNSNR